MAGALRGSVAPAPPRITEIGAGDGRFLLRVAQALARHWRDVTATLLDQQDIVSAATKKALAALGWRAEVSQQDVFDWEPAGGAEEVVIANLFLHHFEDARLSALLARVARHTRLFIALETHRFAWPWLAGRATGLVGCGAVTRHDATASIRAGFLRREISALWPEPAGWQLTERRAGGFSHLFIARRHG